MAKDLNSGKILGEPLRPGILRDCPECRKWFAIEAIAKRVDKIEDAEQRDSRQEVCEQKGGEHKNAVSKYRCKKCGAEFDFAERHPPDAV